MGILFIIAGVIAALVGVTRFHEGDEAIGLLLIEGGISAMVLGVLFYILSAMLGELKRIRAACEISMSRSLPGQPAHRRWWVTGTDTETKMQTSVVVEAVSEEAARTMATDKGVSPVKSVVRYS